MSDSENPSTSVLKPPKPRAPLKDLYSLIPSNEEENTAFAVTRKRRVSFANVNKIKEFNAGAESVLVCHTPAYEEPFCNSSDSSCPTSVLDSSAPGSICLMENENVYTNISVQNTTKNIFYSSVEVNSMTIQNNVQLNKRSDALDLTIINSEVTSKITTTKLKKVDSSSGNQIEFRENVRPDNQISSSERPSSMEFTEVITNETFNPTNLSANSMELTEHIGHHNLDSSSEMPNSTRLSTSNMELTEHIGHYNHLDSSSETPNSTRLSTSNMELTEHIGHYTRLGSSHKIPTSTILSTNNMELTEPIRQYRCLDLSNQKPNSTSFSTNNMELTEPVRQYRCLDLSNQIPNSTSFSTNNMELTEPVRYYGCLDSSDRARDSTSLSKNMDITKDIENCRNSSVYQIKDSSKFSPDNMELTEAIVNYQNDSSCHIPNSTKLSTNMEFTEGVENFRLYSPHQKPNSTRLSTNSMEITEAIENYTFDSSHQKTNLPETLPIHNVENPEAHNTNNQISVDRASLNSTDNMELTEAIDKLTTTQPAIASNGPVKHLQQKDTKNQDFNFSQTGLGSMEVSINMEMTETIAKSTPNSPISISDLPMNNMQQKAVENLVPRFSIDNLNSINSIELTETIKTSTCGSPASLNNMQQKETVTYKETCFPQVGLNLMDLSINDMKLSGVDKSTLREPDFVSNMHVRNMKPTDAGAISASGPPIGLNILDHSINNMELTKGIDKSMTRSPNAVCNMSVNVPVNMKQNAVETKNFSIPPNGLNAVNRSINNMELTEGINKSIPRSRSTISNMPVNVSVDMKQNAVETKNFSVPSNGLNAAELSNNNMELTEGIDKSMTRSPNAVCNMSVNVPVNMKQNAVETKNFSVPSNGLNAVNRSINNMELTEGINKSIPRSRSTISNMSVNVSVDVKQNAVETKNFSVPSNGLNAAELSNNNMELTEGIDKSMTRSPNAVCNMSVNVPVYMKQNAVETKNFSIPPNGLNAANRSINNMELTEGINKSIPRSRSIISNMSVNVSVDVKQNAVETKNFSVPSNGLNAAELSNNNMELTEGIDKSMTRSPNAVCNMSVNVPVNMKQNAVETKNFSVPSNGLSAAELSNNNMELTEGIDKSTARSTNTVSNMSVNMKQNAETKTVNVFPNWLNTLTLSKNNMELTEGIDKSTPMSPNIPINNMKQNSIGTLHSSVPLGLNSDYSMEIIEGTTTPGLHNVSIIPVNNKKENDVEAEHLKFSQTQLNPNQGIVNKMELTEDINELIANSSSFLSDISVSNVNNDIPGNKHPSSPQITSNSMESSIKSMAFANNVDKSTHNLSANIKQLEASENQEPFFAQAVSNSLEITTNKEKIIVAFGEIPESVSNEIELINDVRKKLSIPNEHMALISTVQEMPSVKSQNVSPSLRNRDFDFNEGIEYPCSNKNEKASKKRRISVTSTEWVVSKKSSLKEGKCVNDNIHLFNKLESNLENNFDTSEGELKNYKQTETDISLNVDVKPSEQDSILTNLNINGLNSLCNQEKTINKNMSTQSSDGSQESFNINVISSKETLKKSQQYDAEIDKCKVIEKQLLGNDDKNSTIGRTSIPNITESINYDNFNDSKIISIGVKNKEYLDSEKDLDHSTSINEQIDTSTNGNFPCEFDNVTLRKRTNDGEKLVNLSHSNKIKLNVSDKCGFNEDEAKCISYNNTLTRREHDMVNSNKNWENSNDLRDYENSGKKIIESGASNEDSFSMALSFTDSSVFEEVAAPDVPSCKLYEEKRLSGFAQKRKFLEDEHVKNEDQKSSIELEGNKILSKIFCKRDDIYLKADKLKESVLDAEAVTENYIGNGDHLDEKVVFNDEKIRLSGKSKRKTEINAETKIALQDHSTTLKQKKFEPRSIHHKEKYAVLRDIFNAGIREKWSVKEIYDEWSIELLPGVLNLEMRVVQTYDGFRDVTLVENKKGCKTLWDRYGIDRIKHEFSLLFVYPLYTASRIIDLLDQMQANILETKEFIEELKFVCLFYCAELTNNILTFDLLTMTSRCWIKISINITSRDLKASDISTTCIIGKVKQYKIQNIWDKVTPGKRRLSRFIKELKKQLVNINDKI